LSSVNDANWSGTDLAVLNGGTGASTAADARTNLGLVIGTNVQAFDAELAALAGLVSAEDRVPYFTGAGTAALAVFTGFGRSLVDDADAAAGRATLGLGSLSVLSSVNNDNWSGTDLAVANGGTGASSAGDARTNLGLVIGTNVLAYDADVNSIGAPTYADGDVIYYNSAAFQRLAKGTNGHVMTLAAGLPSWASAATPLWTILDTINITTSSSTWESSAITVGKRYRVQVDYIIAVADARFYIQIHTSTGLKSGGGDYEWSSHNWPLSAAAATDVDESVNDSVIQIGGSTAGGNIGGAAREGAMAIIDFYQRSGEYGLFIIRCAWWSTAGVLNYSDTFGRYKGTLNAITKFRIGFVGNNTGVFQGVVLEQA
jgi:hypothetical protein